MKNIAYTLIAISVSLTLLTGCTKQLPVEQPAVQSVHNVSTVSALNPSNISTNKAFYRPCETVRFTISGSVPAGAFVRYKYLGTTLSTLPISGNTWTWLPPSDDYTGYMAEIFGTSGGSEVIYYTIAVDVSSDPSKFVRNGFLSSYGNLATDTIVNNMARLNRYHINYVQFQDWQFDHHRPLAGTIASPAATWKDIANRTNYKSTVLAYLNSAHGYNMLALHYNLLYGALNDAPADGVLDQWYLYKDASHTTKVVKTLNSPFKSNIWLTNPANTDWQNYIAGKTADAYSVYPFDGYQVDQLGGQGTVYNYNGNTVTLTSTFAPFLTAMKTAAPDKRLVMNAVGQYGQSQIATTNVEFLYTEVWDPLKTFSDLASVITSNDALVSNAKRSVLAAYMNYTYANTGTYFNTPGILLADAVIFAFGGAHLELGGDHMLCNEYFPSSKLKMNTALGYAIVSYYDFMTAYQNLLRGNGTTITPSLRCTNGLLTTNNWPPVSGKVAVMGKHVGTRDVLHLINFTNANTLNWRDDNGTQAAAVAISNPKFTFTASGTVQKIWMASPDLDGGAAKSISFTTSGSDVSFTLPSLQYWDMVVVEY